MLKTPVVDQKPKNFFSSLIPHPSSLKRLWPGLGLAVGLTLLLLVAYQVRPNFDYNSSFVPGSSLDRNLSGFYPAESNPAFSYRWSAANFGLDVPLLGRQEYAVTLEALSVAPNPAPVRLLADGREIANFTPSGELKAYTLRVPADAVANGGNLKLSWATTPFEVRGDNRQLGVLVKSLKVEAVGGGLVLPPVGAFVALWVLCLGLYLLVVGLLNQPGNYGGYWPVAVGALLVGAMACGLAAFNRPLFANVLPSLTGYFGFATFAMYFFLVGAPLADWLWRLAQAGLQKSGLQIPPTDNRQAGLQIPATNRWFSATEDDISPKLTVIVGVGLVVIALVLRLVNIMGLPIFLDEALHINAARAAQAGQLYELATEGKVFHHWVTGALYLFGQGQDWLLITRLFSVPCGLAIMGCAYSLGTRLHSRRAGLVAAGLWAVLPFAVYHERMALVDPLMTFFTTFALVLSLRLINAPSWYKGLGWCGLIGLCVAAAYLTKVPGVVALLGVGLALLFFPRSGSYFRQLSYLGLICALAFLLIVPPLAPVLNIWNRSQVNEKLVPGLNIAQLQYNIREETDWLVSYFSWPLLLAAFVAIGWGILNRNTRRRSLFLTLNSLAIIVLIAAVSKIIFPRYILFALPPLIVLLAIQAVVFFDRLKVARTRLLAAGLALLLLTPALYFNLQAFYQPDKMPLPATDRFQYVEDWPAGYGFPETVAYLKAQSNGQPVSALVVNYPFPAKDSLDVELKGDKRVQVIGIEPPAAGLENRIKRALKNGAAFLVLNQPQPEDNKLLDDARYATPDLTYKLVFKAPKPGGASWVEIYAIIPNS